jgi:phage terminase large subunit GpA-like protein
MEGPWLSTTGKKRAKPKFASAEAKRQHEQLSADWQQLKTQYEPVKKTFNRSFTNSKMPRIVIPRSTDHIPSRADSSGVAARAPDKVYTGTAVVGISTLHKSNGVPVFSKEEAIDISKMRRG